MLLPRGKISTAQLVQPISNGALVLELDTDFDGCMRVVQELSRTKDIYLANSMNSLRIEGQKTVSIEIAQQLGWTSPDWIVIPGGNLGNASAVGKGFVLMKELGLVDRLPAARRRAGGAREPALAGDARARAPADRRRAGRADRRRGRRSRRAIQIGAPVSAKRALRALEALDGVVEQASEQELADAAARADRAGLFTCPHTGVALAALEKLAARGVDQAAASGWSSSPPRTGSSSPTSRSATTRGRCPGSRSPLRNPLGEARADARRGPGRDCRPLRAGVEPGRR